MRRVRQAFLAIAILSLAAVAWSQDVFQERQAALRAAKQAYETAVNSRSAEDAEVAQRTYQYGLALLRVYEAAESRDILELAVRRYDIAYGKDSPEKIKVLLVLAQANAMQRRNRHSKRNLERAHELVSTAFDHGSIEYADNMHVVGRVALTMAFKEAAYEYLDAAHQVYLATLDPMSIRLGDSYHFLGMLRLDEGRNDDAEPFLEAALKIFDPADPQRYDRHIQVLADWGGGLEAQGLRDEATIHYLAAGRLQEPLTTELLPLHRVAPVYPVEALRDGVSGFVEWRFTVDERGFVVDPEIVERQGARSFEDASRRALLQFRYPPRFVDGEPVATEGVTSRITFMLED